MFEFFYNLFSDFVNILLSNPILLAVNVIFLVFLVGSSLINAIRYRSEGSKHGKSND